MPIISSPVGANKKLSNLDDLGTVDQVLTSNGAGNAPTFKAAAGGGGTKLYLSAADVAFSADTNEITLATVSVPGGTLGTNNGIRAKLWFSSIEANAAGDTLTFKVVYGTESGTRVITPNTTNKVGWIEVILFAREATDSQETNLDIQFQDWASSQSTTISRIYAATTNAYFTQDSTGALTFAITAQWSARGVGTSANMTRALIEKIV